MTIILKIILRIVKGVLALVMLAMQATATQPYHVPEHNEAALQSGEAITQTWYNPAQSKGVLNVYGAIQINAAPEIVWDLMTNCASNFDIIKNLVKCEVVEKDSDGLWDIRKQVFRLGPFLPHVKTHFRSDYVLNENITIQRVGGDLIIQNAVWTLNLHKNGATRVSYKAELKSKLPVPRSLMKRATEQDTPHILRALKTHAEAAAHATTMKLARP